MEILSYIEVIATLITIIGAIFMGKADDKSLLIAFILYTFANSIYLIISLNHSMLFLFIQMLFFYSTSIFGILNKAEVIGLNKVKILSILLFIQSIIIITLINNVRLKIEDNINYIELTASVIVILGSIWLTINNVRKIYGFIAFLIGDLIYIKVGLDNNMIPFAVQSMFFVFTSSYGIYNSEKEWKNIKEYNSILS